MKKIEIEECDYCTNCKLVEQYNELVERIDKAVEYIEDNNLIVMNKEYLPDGVINVKDYKLLEILKGDSNE